MGHDVSAPRAQSAANPDLARAFGNAGQHDVHNTNAAHKQRDGGDRAEDNIEDLFGALSAFEQFQRHDDLIILFLMIALEDGLDGIGDTGDVFERVHFDSDFVELNALGFEAATAAAHENFTVTLFGGLERNEHAVGGGFGAILRFITPGRATPGFHDANDLIILAPHAHMFP